MKARDLSNEDLAAILRSMCATGICPSRDEKEYLQEAADRLEQKSETVTEFADRCRECGAKYGKMLEQKLGRWKVHKNYYECSNCESQISNEFFVNYQFCPHCGAKMESEE